MNAVPACFLVFLVFAWHGGIAPVKAATAAGSTGKTRTALVIGNARYEASVGALRNTVNDAKAVAKTLRSLGFAVIERHDVTRDQLLKAVVEFRATLGGAEVGLFYFAGHGISVRGANYLIPLKSGYTPDGSDDVTLRLLAETKLFNVEQAVADMSAAGARCNLVILDACRTTAVARTGRTRDSTGGRGGLAEMTPPAGSLIAFATDAGQVALDGDGSNGLYTDELLKFVRTPGLTIEQVFKRTRAGVLERSGGTQIPAEYSRLVGDDIYLAGAPLMAAAASSTLTPADPVAEALSRAIKAEPVAIPTLGEVGKLAAAGKAEECVAALRAIAEEKGPGAYADEPLSLLLDQVKETLKDETGPSVRVADAASICETVAEALPHCLPASHERYGIHLAKAHNRRGDAFLLLGRAGDAVAAYQTALASNPNDSYVLYNRGRAYLALGRREEAQADFTAAASPEFKQPKARQLAEAALASMK